MHCINLKEQFGDRYRISFDPAYHEKGVPREKLDPWMMVIPCSDGGAIFPHGADLLAYEFTSKTSTRLKRLVSLGCTVHQDGDEERCVLIPVELFDAVAEIAKPRKRRIVSPESADRLKQYRYSVRQPAPPIGP